MRFRWIRTPLSTPFIYNKDIPLQVYWTDVSKAVQGDAGKTQPQAYRTAWKGVDGSTLSAEAKSSAAHAFAAKLSPEALAALAPRNSSGTFFSFA
jgi:hypothetical protein